jgi:putative endonuclease
MSTNISKGRKGEERAIQFMEEKGYKMIAQNYRFKRAEIDLIFQKENLIVFTEVKLRSKVFFGMPEEAVDEKKAERIIDAADNYIYETDWKGDIRFDIIAIYDRKEVCHFEDAFC